MSREAATVTCDLCGRREREGPATLSWTTAVESGRPRWFCPGCSRRHLRGMEARLDSEHW